MVQTVYDARFHPGIRKICRFTCSLMAGTVQKKSARAKQKLLTQHQQFFRAAHAILASAIATKSSIGEKNFCCRKDFFADDLRLSIAHANARGEVMIRI